MIRSSIAKTVQACYRSSRFAADRVRDGDGKNSPSLSGGRLFAETLIFGRADIRRQLLSRADGRESARTLAVASYSSRPQKLESTRRRRRGSLRQSGTLEPRLLTASLPTIFPPSARLALAAGKYRRRTSRRGEESRHCARAPPCAHERFLLLALARISPPRLETLRARGSLLKRTSRKIDCRLLCILFIYRALNRESRNFGSHAGRLPAILT